MCIRDSWVAEQDVINQGKERLSKQDYDTYMNMSNALNRNSSSKVLMNCLTEKEVGFEIEIDGFKLRGKVDGAGEITEAYAVNDLDLIVGEKFQIDLKKVADATYKKLRWNITDMNYDLQAGLYSSGRRISTYFLVFIDKMCNITVVKLSRDTLDSGYAKLENALSEFTRCAEENKWHASYEFFNGGYILV